MGLCKPNRNRRAHLKSTLSSYLNKVLEKENPNLRFFYLNPSLHLLNIWVLENRRKRSCWDSCAPFGSISSKVFGTNNWRSYWCFYVKLLQINYNNQKGCCRVSHIEGFMQKSQSCTGIHAKEKTCTRSSPIRDWSNNSTVGWYFGIGQVVVKNLYL